IEEDHCGFREVRYVYTSECNSFPTKSATIPEPTWFTQTTGFPDYIQSYLADINDDGGTFDKIAEMITDLSKNPELVASLRPIDWEDED
ncbi:MAG: hypothetical protein EB060_11525, partial [Proteobacteria bacterium]|nr:hypothetical protein [Pseudomonadota bacterium]